MICTNHLDENWGSTDGFVCLAYKDISQRFYHWPSEREQLVDTANTLNAAESVYLSWNLFEDRQRRSEGAKVVPGLLLDVDLAGGKHAATNLPADEEQALAVLAEANLPEPTLIHSGGGLYVHYLFAEPFVIASDRDRRRVHEVLRSATRLAIRSFQKAGLHLDNLSDLSRIIRPIGAINWKYGPETHVTLVQPPAGSLGPRTSIRDFEVLIGTGQRRVASSTMGTTGTPTEDEPKGSFQQIERFCAFVRRMEEEPEAITEPDWYAAATLAARCTDGEDRFHSLSSLDQARYDEGETAAKFRHGKLARPRTCQSIEHDSGFEGCKRCPFKAAGFRSPYALAFGDPTLLQLQSEYILTTDTDTYRCVTRDEPDLRPKSFNHLYGHVVERPHEAFITDKRSPKVMASDYRAGESGLIITRPDGVRLLNLWQEGGVQSAPGDYDIILKHFSLLLPEMSHRDWVLDYLAHLCQRPGIKISHAILLIGEQGVGKSFLSTLVKQLFGDRNVFIDDAGIHASNYRTSLGNNQVLVIEEMATSGKWEVSNSLKPWLTGDTVQADDKYIRSHQVRTPRGVFVLTNSAIPAVFEPGERRNAVFRIDAEPFNQKYFDMLWDEGIAQLPQFKQHLLDRDISTWSPHARPPMTDAKREIIEGSRTPAAADIQHLIDIGSLKGDLVTAEDILDRLNLHSEKYTRIQITKALQELRFRKLDKTKLSGGCTANL